MWPSWIIPDPLTASGCESVWYTDPLPSSTVLYKLTAKLAEYKGKYLLLSKCWHWRGGICCCQTLRDCCHLSANIVNFYLCEQMEFWFKKSVTGINSYTEYSRVYFVCTVLFCMFVITTEHSFQWKICISLSISWLLLSFPCNIVK